MGIGRFARGLVAPPCQAGCDFPTVNFLARAGLATAALWWLWLAPLAAYLSTCGPPDREALAVDFGFAAVLLACGGAFASVLSLAACGWLADRLGGGAWRG